MARQLMIKIELECQRRGTHQSFDTALSEDLPLEFRKLLSELS